MKDSILLEKEQQKPCKDLTLMKRLKDRTKILFDPQLTNESLSFRKSLYICITRPRIKLPKHDKNINGKTTCSNSQS